MIAANKLLQYKRKRGPAGKFTGSMLTALLEYMATPGATYKEAGKKFGCHPITVGRAISKVLSNESELKGAPDLNQERREVNPEIGTNQQTSESIAGSGLHDKPDKE